MKWLTLLLTSALVTPAFADSEFAGGFTKIKNESFRRRFTLKGEMFITDATGKKLVAPTTDLHVWQAGVKSNKIEAQWSTKAKGIREVAVLLNWELKDDNSMAVHIQQYDSMERGKKVKFGKLMREEKIEVENFAPVSYVAESADDHRVILRMTPEIEAVREDGNLSQLTIGGDRGSFTITDNQGYLWGDNIRMGGVYSGITCFRGSFVISLYPFKGAKEIGEGFRDRITLNLTDTLRVTIKSDTDVVPGEFQAKIYGKYVPGLKSESVNSTTSFGQEKIEYVDPRFGL